MKTKIALLSLLAIFISTAAFCQDVFKVLAAKGKSSVSGVALKVGSGVKAGSEITVDENSYLGLRHASNGKTVEIRTKGTYKVSDLEKKVQGQGAGMADKYLTFVANELTKEDEDIDENRHKHMMKTGAVDRGPETEIIVMLPKTAKVLGNKAMLNWFVKPNEEGAEVKVAKYKITVKDMFGNVLIDEETASNNFTIDFNSDKFKGQQALIYSLTSESDENLNSAEQSLLKVSNREAEQFNVELASLGDDNSAITKIVQAQYFEEKKLYSDAIIAYLEAMKMAPEVKSYKRMYYSFLEKIPAEAMDNK